MNVSTPETKEEFENYYYFRRKVLRMPWGKVVNKSHLLWGKTQHYLMEKAL